jgi:hypothetical protein
MKPIAANDAKVEAPVVAKFAYQPHPIAAIFPLLDPTSAEFMALVEDIKENDLQVPIVLYEDKILDGRNRYLALQISEREIKETHFRKYYGSDLIGLVLSANLHRRHLNESQRAMVGAKMASFEVGDNQHKPEGCSIEQASKLCKVGISSIVRARKVLGFGDPQTIQQVEAGQLSVSKAAALKAEQGKPRDFTLLPSNGVEDDADDDEADVETLAEYHSLEGKLLTKLGDLSAAKAEEHSEITIAKIKNQLVIMKKAAAKAAKLKVA